MVVGGLILVPEPWTLEEWVELGLEESVPLLPGRLLERNETGGVGGPDTRSAVLHRLVGYGELAQVVADHLRLQEAKR